MAAPGTAGSRLKSILVSPIVLVLVVVGAAALWFDRPLGEKPTLGAILVDTPEIYTRERLVNDRFLQDAWLSARLNASEILDARQVRDDAAATVQAGTVKEPASGEANSASAAAPGTSPGIEPRLASKVMLLDQVDYRDVVRNLLIENQLDDEREIFNGNSLYKLKFDTAILPGVNTQASARISVRLLVPGFLGADKNIADASSLSELGSKDDVDTWRRIYAKWIESLHSRLNQTQQELRDAYRNNEFSHSDYVRLVRFLSDQLRIPAATVPQCPALVVASQGQESMSLRLSTEEHAARKDCVNALVEK